MSKILFVENLSLTKDNPMSTCYPLKCKSIANDERFDIYDISKKMIDFSKYETVVFGCRSIYLYKIYKGNEKQLLADKINMLCGIKNKYFIIQDMHAKTYGNIDKLCQFLENNKINIIFTFYNNTEANAIKSRTPSVSHLYLPHHIDTNIFQDLHLNKTYDILLYGSVHPKHYPFRKRLFELLLDKKEEYNFNVLHVPMPSQFNPNVCEDGLAKLINMSKISIATKSKYNYLVGKYFEIVMGKSIIAGDIPTDGISIFKNKILELNEKMTDDEILTKIKYCLEHYNDHKENINSLYAYVKNNHGLDTYVNHLYNIIATHKN